MQVIQLEVRRLLEQGLWDKAWRTVQEGAGGFPKDERFKCLYEEVSQKARDEVPWWTNSAQRRSLLSFAKRHEGFLAEREKLAAKGNVHKMGRLFNELSRNLRDFSSQVGELPEPAWEAINCKAKECEFLEKRDLDDLRWPASIREFRKFANDLCDGIYGVVSEPALLAKDAVAREVMTAHLWAIQQLYDTEDPYRGAARLHILSGETRYDQEEAVEILSDDTVNLLHDILQRITAGRVFNRVTCPIDDEGHVHCPDYLVNLREIGYTPQIEQDDFLNLINNQKAFRSAEIIASSSEHPPVLVLHLNEERGWRFTVKHAGDHAPQGEEARLRVLLFDGKHPVRRETAYYALLDGRTLRLCINGTTLLGEALEQGTARIVMTHILTDCKRFHRAFLLAAEKLDVTRECGDMVMRKTKAKILKRVLRLEEVVPALAEENKVALAIRRARQYERSGNLRQALKVLKKTDKRFPQNQPLLEESRRILQLVERGEVVAQAKHLLAKGSLGAREQALVELETFFCVPKESAPEEMKRKAFGDDTEAMRVWNSLATTVAEARHRLKTKRLHRIQQDLKALQNDICNAQGSKGMSIFDEILDRIGAAIVQVPASTDTEWLQEHFQHVVKEYKTKLEEVAEREAKEVEEEALRYIVGLEQCIDERLPSAELDGLLARLDAMPDDIHDVWQRLSGKQVAQIVEMQSAIRDEINGIFAKRERIRPVSRQKEGGGGKNESNDGARESSGAMADKARIDTFMRGLPKRYRKLNVAMKKLLIARITGHNGEEALDYVATVLADMKSIEAHELGKYEDILRFCFPGNPL